MVMLLLLLLLLFLVSWFKEAGAPRPRAGTRPPEERVCVGEARAEYVGMEWGSGGVGRNVEAKNKLEGRRNRTFSQVSTAPDKIASAGGSPACSATSSANDGTQCGRGYTSPL